MLAAVRRGRAGSVQVAGRCRWTLQSVHPGPNVSAVWRENSRASARVEPVTPPPRVRPPIGPSNAQEDESPSVALAGSAAPGETTDSVRQQCSYASHLARRARELLAV